jgi:hypothetical protein
MLYIACVKFPDHTNLCTYFILLGPFLLCCVSKQRVFAKSQSELLHDWRVTANQFVSALIPLRLTATNFFQLNPYDQRPYVSFSLTGRWVCRLQLFLVSPAQSFWGSNLAVPMTKFYSLRYKTAST